MSFLWGGAARFLAVTFWDQPAQVKTMPTESGKMS
jgi:hypothetical protein